MERMDYKKAARTFYLLIALFSLPFVLLNMEDRLEKEKRGVASESSAIHYESADLTQIPDEDFIKTFKYQILKNAEVLHEQETSGIRMSAVYVKNSQGLKAFVCEKYDVIEYRFSLEGMAISGTIPEITVQGSCLLSEDQQSVEPLWVPWRYSILKAQTHLRTRFDYEGLDLQGQWVLSGIRFIDSQSQESIDISSYELTSVLGTAPAVPLQVTQ